MGWGLFKSTIQFVVVLAVLAFDILHNEAFTDWENAMLNWVALSTMTLILWLPGIEFWCVRIHDRRDSK